MNLTAKSRLLKIDCFFEKHFKIFNIACHKLLENIRDRLKLKILTADDICVQWQSKLSSWTIRT